MALSAPGIAYRNIRNALTGLVGGRVYPFSEAQDGIVQPHIRVWIVRGTADKQAAALFNYALVFNVVATDLKKDVTLELQEDIHQALDERGVQDKLYDPAGPFAPEAGDAYAVFNITEGLVLDGHFVDEDKSTRHATNGWQYQIGIGEV